MVEWGPQVERIITRRIFFWIKVEFLSLKTKRREQCQHFEIKDYSLCPYVGFLQSSFLATVFNVSPPATTSGFKIIQCRLHQRPPQLAASVQSHLVSSPRRSFSAVTIHRLEEVAALVQNERMAGIGQMDEYRGLHWGWAIQRGCFVSQDCWSLDDCEHQQPTEVVAGGLTLAKVNQRLFWGRWKLSRGLCTEPYIFNRRLLFWNGN